jgi:hypothetical protein
MPTKKELPLSPEEIPEFCKSWIPHKGPLKYEPFFEDWRWNLLTIAAFLASGPANIAHTIKYGLKDEFFKEVYGSQKVMFRNYRCTHMATKMYLTC